MSDRDDESRLDQLEERCSDLDRRLFWFETWVKVLGGLAVVVGFSVPLLYHHLDTQLEGYEKAEKQAQTDINEAQGNARDINSRYIATVAKMDQIARWKPPSDAPASRGSLAGLLDDINHLGGTLSGKLDGWSAYCDDLVAMGSLATRYVQLIARDPKADPSWSGVTALRKAAASVRERMQLSPAGDTQYKRHHDGQFTYFEEMLETFQSRFKTQRKVEANDLNCWEAAFPYWLTYVGAGPSGADFSACKSALGLPDYPAGV